MEKKKNGVVSLVLVLVLTLCVMFALKFTLGADKAPSGYTPGEYYGLGQGIHGDMYVKVAFDQSRILSVEVVEHSETAGMCEEAIEAVPQRIIEAQSYEVDSVSGASYTSEGIKQAVKNAVDQASGKAEILQYAPVIKEDPTPLGYAYTPGTYTAKAEGFEGNVTVEVVFTKDSIKSVVVTEHHDTEEICSVALSKVPESIVAYQTYEVDAASGATWTSKGIMNAVKACVEQAKK